MSEHTLCGAEVEFAAETRQLLENLESREPQGHANELTQVGQRWWGGEPDLPIGPQYPHHEQCQLEDQYMRWLKTTGWILRHPVEIPNRVGLTAITWVIPSAVALVNYVQCCVTQVTRQGTIQGRTYKFWVSLAPELRPNGGKQPPRDTFQPVEMGLTDNGVVFNNLLHTPGWWPVECAVTNSSDRRLRGRWEDFPFKRTRSQLQAEREACKIQFDELDVPQGAAPFTLQDPAIEGLLRGLEALVAWGDYEMFAPWNNHPQGVKHPERGERFAASSKLLHQVNRKHEVIVPQASLVVDKNYLGSCPQLIQKTQIKRKDVLCLPFQYTLPAGENPLDLPQLELASPFPGAVFPQVLLDFNPVPAAQVVRMTAQEMDRAAQQNHDWKKMYSPRKEQNPWEEYKLRLHKAVVTTNPELGSILLGQHPGYSVKLSGINNLYREETGS